MGMLIVLLIVLGLGIFISIKLLDSYSTDGAGIVTVILSVFIGVWLIIHCIIWASASYEYKCFVVEREAFVQTLNSSRENGNPIETAAIVEKVAEWNVKLATQKLDNKTFMFGSYVDDRIESLEPIR